MKTLTLIDYGSGNLRSAQKALARASADGATGHDIRLTANADEVRKAERIVLPGVGAFGDCMGGLAAIPGMIEALNDAVIKRGIPFLGICVGMQLLATTGREFETSDGLGWIAGDVVPLTPDNPSLKIPHMGWNEIVPLRAHALTRGLPENAHAYFVHSFCFAATNPDHVIANCDYGGPFTAIIGRDNIAGTQFHPEKSQAIGLTLLQNFLTWAP